MKVISKKITDTKVVKPGEVPVAIATQAAPLERDEILSGSSYKTKVDDFSYYITINNIEHNGVIRPYEIFINTKNATKFASLTVLTRLISGFFRTGHDYAFIATELKDIIDPAGGYWKKAKYYNSFEAELGEILEKHFNEISKNNARQGGTTSI